MTSLNTGNPSAVPSEDRPNRSGNSAVWQFLGAFLLVAGIILAADLGWLASISKWVHALPLGDKLVHAMAMGAVCGLADRAFPSRSPLSRAPWLRVTPLIVTLLVLGEEVSQLWIPGRNFDLGDVAADLLGIGLALWWRHDRHRGG